RVRTPGTASRRQDFKPRPQRVHGATGLVDVVHMEAGREIGADSPQKLLQPPSVTGAPALADYEAALLFVTQIPCNRLVARDRCRKVKVEFATLEFDRITSGQAVQSRHMTYPRASMCHREHQRHP